MVLICNAPRESSTDDSIWDYMSHGMMISVSQRSSNDLNVWSRYRSNQIPWKSNDYNISTISIAYPRENKIYSTPFCSVSHALSNGIWFSLNCKRNRKKKIKPLIRWYVFFNRKFRKSDVSEHRSHLIISASERSEKMPYRRFDAELNGLQTDVKRFLAIDFLSMHFIKILKIVEIFLR